MAQNGTALLPQKTVKPSSSNLRQEDGPCRYDGTSRTLVQQRQGIYTTGQHGKAVQKTHNHALQSVRSGSAWQAKSHGRCLEESRLLLLARHSNTSTTGYTLWSHDGHYHHPCCVGVEQSVMRNANSQESCFCQSIVYTLGEEALLERSECNGRWGSRSG